LEISAAGDTNRMAELIRLARKKGVAIASVSQRKPSLEDVFLHYCREQSGSSQDG
jgi:D-arabinose 5-phosphate isomerase GutQ